MKTKIILLMFIVTFSMFMVGCTTTETLAKGLNSKDVSLNGTNAIAKVGVDENRIPTTFFMLNTGDYTSMGGNVEHEMVKSIRRKDASIFNSNAISESEIIIYAGNDPEKSKLFSDSIVEQAKARLAIEKIKIELELEKAKIELEKLKKENSNIPASTSAK